MSKLQGSPSMSNDPAKQSLSERGRIVLVSHQFGHNDGQGRVNFEVALRALELGYNVTILATHCAAEILRHPQATYIRINNGRVPSALLRNLAFARSTARWLSQHRTEYDLALANGFITWAPCDVNVAHFVHTAWARNVNFPFKSLGPYSLYQRIYTALNARWERHAFSQARKVIAVSEVIARELRSIGVPPGRITTIPNGVDTEQFHPGPSDRAGFGLPDGVPLALFAGDIKIPRKNLDTVLRALQRVPGMILAVAGAKDGSPYPALARQLGIKDRVFFLGKVYKMAELMRTADLFIFPSRYEPFGLVVTEAMASAVPVIVSSCSGAADFVAGGGVVLEDPNNSERLSSVMAELASDPKRRAEMALEGRARALEMQWSTMADEYMRVFDEVLKAQGLT